jgi:UDP-glucose 4-epimerase
MPASRSVAGHRHVAAGVGGGLDDDFMKILVTGSAGHLGEALMRTLPDAGHNVVGIDLLPSPFTTVVGSITDRSTVRQAMQGVDAVLHTATLHKPHVGTHSLQAFVDTNITGTLNLLEAAVEAGVPRFVFTSTTSAFGDALSPPAGSPAAWITEDVVPVPKNIYGVTKVAAEDLCRLFHRNQGLPCVVLRVARFFPEADDNEDRRTAHSDANLKVNEFLHRRVDISDVVGAHTKALDRVQDIGFGMFIVSATTPFRRADLADLRSSPHAVVSRRVPDFAEVFEARGWKMSADIDRVYVNDCARSALGWEPEYDFHRLLRDVAAGAEPGSALARRIGSKGYHAQGPRLLEP